MTLFGQIRNTSGYIFYALQFHFTNQDFMAQPVFVKMESQLFSRPGLVASGQSSVSAYRNCLTWLLKSKAICREQVWCVPKWGR